MITTHPTLASQRIAKASLAGVGISLLCFLPPILHFISGPLGPFIAGMIVGTRAKVTGREGLLIGLGMGLIWGIIGAVGVFVAELISAESIPRYGQLPVPPVWIIPLIPFTYVSFLASSGAMLGGYLARKEEESRARA